jgi:hypothetical protein
MKFLPHHATAQHAIAENSIRVYWRAFAVKETCVPTSSFPEAAVAEIPISNFKNAKTVIESNPR